MVAGGGWGGGGGTQRLLVREYVEDSEKEYLGDTVPAFNLGKCEYKKKKMKIKMKINRKTNNKRYNETKRRKKGLVKLRNVGK